MFKSDCLVISAAYGFGYALHLFVCIIASLSFCVCNALHRFVCFLYLSFLQTRSFFHSKENKYLRNIAENTKEQLALMCYMFSVDLLKISQLGF